MAFLLLVVRVFQNLIKATTILVVCFIFLFNAYTSEAATRYSVNTGNWNSTSTWSTSSGGGSGASVPVAGDIVYIEGNKTVTVNVNASCASISIAAGSMLSVAGYNLTVSSTTTVSGTMRFTSTTGTKTFGNVVMSGGIWTSNAGETYAITSLTLTGSTFNGSSTGILNVSSNVTVTAGSSNIFNAITMTVTGTTSVGGTLTFSSSSGTKTFIGLITIAEGGAWQNTGNSAFTIRGGITNNGTFSSGTGIYTFNTNAQQLIGIFTVQNITITGVTVTNNGNLTVTASLTGTGGLTNEVNSHLNLDFTGSVGITTLTASAAGNIVDYRFAGAQTIRAITYHHLTLTGSNTKTLSGTTTVQGNLSISGTDASNTCTLNPSTYNMSITGITSIDNFGIFNDNNNSGTNTFTGAVTINGSGAWISTAVTTPANLVFMAGITHNGATDFNGYAATFSGIQTLLLNSSGDILFNTGASAVNSIAVSNTLYLQSSGSGIFQFIGSGNFNLAAGIVVYNQAYADMQQVMVGANAASTWINDANATLVYRNSSGPLSTGTFTCTASGNTVNYGGSGSQTVKDGSYNNLTLSAARGSGTISIGTINISGSYSKTATFTSGTGITAGTITYNGSSSQEILGTDSYFNYNNLTVNNSSGLTMNSNVVVNGTLGFTDGKITTGGYSMILGNSATVTGVGAGKYIHGNLVKGIAASTVSKTFEVGDASIYAPVTITFTGSTNSSGSVLASTTTGEHPQLNSSAISSSSDVNRYWTLSNNGVSGFSTYNAVFNFTAGDLDSGADYLSFMVGNYNASAWNYPDIGNRTSTSIQATGMTLFGDFQAGTCLTPLQPSQITGNASPCSGTDAITYSVINTAGITYSWTVPSDWSITAGQGTNSITATAGSDDGNITVTPGNGCTTGTSQVLAVTAIESPTGPGSISGLTAVCEGSEGLSYAVAAVQGITYTWELPDGWTQTAGGTSNSITAAATSGSGYVKVTPSNVCGSGSRSVLGVLVSAEPDVLASATPTEVCSGAVVQLTSSAGPSGPSSTLINEGFNGITNNWLTINNSSGGDTAAAAWILRPDGYASTYSGPMHSNDASQFYFTDSDAQGQGTVTSTILQSPPMSTMGYSSLLLNFYHYFRVFLWGETGSVQVSTNGITWTDVVIYNSNRGTPNNFSYSSINLNAYTGNPTFYVRFKYDAAWGYYWALDNVTLTGTPSVFSYDYSWIADPSGTSGLPAGAGTPSPANATVSANPTATTSYTVSATNGNGCSGSESTLVTVLPGSPVSVSIAASSNPVCVSSNVTFTATPVNGGSSPVYQWKVNGVNVGSNSPTYSTSSLVNGDIVSCIMTSNASCVTGNPATSNTVTMTILPSVAASVNISASSNPVCSGTVVNFTATPVNGGSSPVYLWKVNGSNVGTNSPTYSTGGLANSDVVTCIMTSNASCVTGSPATSNAVSMTVNSNVTAGVSIAASATNICSGNSVTYTATPVNGGSGPVYQWKVNGANVGANSSTYTSTALVNNDEVSCIMTSNAACVSGSPATSGTITMTVNQNVNAGVSISPSANPVCSGIGVTFTAVPQNGGSSPSYQWNVNGLNVGSNSPTYSNASLITNDVVTCIMTSNATCVTGSPVTSNDVTMMVLTNLPVSVSIEASANPICEGASVTFTATPVNGGIMPVYQWKVNGNNVGSNSPTYASSNLSDDDVITCQLTSSETCTSGNPATSNEITMTVNPLLSAGVSISASSNPVCSGTLVTFTAVPENGGAAPVYQWQLNGSNVGTNSSTYTNANLVDNDLISCIMTSNASCITENPATSNTITMTVNTVLPVGVSITASSNPICQGVNVVFTATPVNGGSSPTYQWKLNGDDVGTNSVTYENSSLSNNDQVQCVMTSNAGCTTGSPASSNTITMVVNPNFAVSVSITASNGPTICSGTIVTFTANPVNGGSSPSFEWMKNGENVGSNSSSYTDASLLNNDAVQCILTSNLTCTTGNPATSNIVLMVVAQTPAIPVSISASPSAVYSTSTNPIVLTASGGGGANAVLSWYFGGCGSGNIIGTGNTISISPPVTTSQYYARWENGSCYSPCMATTVTILHNYRSKATGNWNESNTWEYYRGGAWIPAVSAPSANDGTITLRSPYVVTVPSSGGYINVDEITIDAGAKLVINVCPSNWWFNIVDGPGTDLTINGTMEYQDDKVSMVSGASMGVGDGGKFQHNLNYPGNYPITVPTASWHTNSTYEVISSNQLAPSEGLNQNFGNFTWNSTGQVTDINLGGSLSTINGNLTVISTGTHKLALTNSTALTLSIGKDLILQEGTLDFSTSAAPVKILNLYGNYTQTGGTFRNSNANQLTVNFKGAGKTFTQSGGTLIPNDINWDINSNASLSLSSNLPVASGKSCTLSGTLDCGTNAVTGTGTFVMTDLANLIIASPHGITGDPGSGNIQTSGANITTNGNFFYNGSAAQVTGNRLPSVVRTLTINNGNGTVLTNSVTVNGSLSLTAGAFSIAGKTLILQNSDAPLITGTGTLTTSGTSNLGFGSPGNTAGAAFTLPDNLFTTPPLINNLSIYRVNSLELNNQQMGVKGFLLCNGDLNTNNNLTLLSDAAQTALIDGAGNGNITGNVTVQRYLPSAFGYKYLSTPFQSATVNAFSPYVDLSASFPCFYRYDETNSASGWESYTDPSDLLIPMEGYAANLGPSSDPQTIGITGAVNNGLQSAIALYNHDQPYTQGFHLAGNPYPSPIDWNASTGWTRMNIDNAVYFFNAGNTDMYTGTYSSYVNGVSSDGIASNIIPAMQGFFIHVADGNYPVAASFGMDNRIRVNNLTPVFHKQANGDKPLIRIKAVSADNEQASDPAVLYFEDYASNQYDKDFDALKLWNTEPGVPNLYFLAPLGEKLSISAIPNTGDSNQVIPLGISSDQESWFDLSADEITGLPPSLNVYLSDAHTGVVRNLQNDKLYRAFVQQGEVKDRFSLVFSYHKLSHEPPSTDVFIVVRVDGALEVALDPAAGSSANLVICNMLGQVMINRRLEVSGTHEIKANLPRGAYVASLYTTRGVHSQKILIDN